MGRELTFVGFLESCDALLKRCRVLVVLDLLDAGREVCESGFQFGDELGLGDLERIHGDVVGVFSLWSGK